MVSDLVWLTGSSGSSPLPVPTHAWGKPYRDKEQEQCHESAATCFQKILKKLFTVLHDDSLSVDRYLSSMKLHTVCPSTSGVGVAHSAAVTGGLFRHLLSNPPANTLKMSSRVLPGADPYSRANQPESVTQEVRMIV